MSDEARREVGVVVMPQDDMLETAWNIIANAGGGNWGTQTQEWQDAAARWRDRYFAILDRPSTPAPGLDVERLAALLAQPEHFGLLEDDGEAYEPEWWQEKAAALGAALEATDPG